MVVVLRWPAVLLFADRLSTRFLLQRCQLGLLMRWRRHGLILLGIGTRGE